ncbi:MAG TPA: deoxyribose-phosphate aldolase [Blastocatellia bacterium]|nr:deoxyribose-phosphate aldolase [Blastocatellia bacterium]
MQDNVNIEELVSQITDVILSRLGSSGSASECAVYHDECFVKCPDRMQSLIASGGVRFGLSGPESEAARQVARYIDHTLLKPDATRDEILKICEEGALYGFASVCINPIWVREAACALRGSGVKVCTVIGFPLGANTPDTKSFEARRAIFDGASELDMVINVGALKSGDDDLALRDIAGVVGVAHEVGYICKVIIETALLTDDEKIRACMLSKEAGADFVKTSTGFSKGGATVADIALMRRVVGGEMGVKASGGVKDLKQAQDMIRAGATRIGASVGVKIIQEAAGGQVTTNGQSATSY